MILIYSGVGHNFITHSTVLVLRLSVDPLKKLWVRLGVEHQVITKGKRSRLALQLGELEVIIDAYEMNLEGVD